jgi:hypothetical protein
MEMLQGFLELGVHWNGSAPAPFCDALSKQKLIANRAVATEDHFPPKPCYLTSTQAGLEA